MLRNRIDLQYVKLPKTPTGIQGLDEITRGGLPQGRPTLVYGGAGCGKTVLAMEFLVQGAIQYDEPGIMMTFGESTEDLLTNFSFFGVDLEKLIEEKELLIDAIEVSPADFIEAGSYDLEGLFVRLGHAIDSINARRVVLDTIETLFAGFTDQALLRIEIQRLFRWLKARGMTAVITGEKSGEGLSTRHDLEEYISDCVIMLDHRVSDQLSTRRLRVVKYRGSAHGTNEYPFLITDGGLYVLPITSVGLEHEVSVEQISTGILGLDKMLEGRGYYRGSTVLVSGTAGTGKSSVAAHFVDSACQAGNRCLYFSFEESASQIVRNMRSIGLELEPWIEKELLQIHSVRPTTYGLEGHLVAIYQQIIHFDPAIIVVDPMTSLMNIGGRYEVKSTLVRLIDFLRAKNRTVLLTSLTGAEQPIEQTDIDVSSLADTWLLLRTLESSGERNRVLYVIKSRGMAHSNQVREFHLTNEGVKLSEPYLGEAGVLTGAARMAQEAQDQLEILSRQQEVERRRRELKQKQAVVEAQMAALQAQFEADKEELERYIEQAETRLNTLGQDRVKIAKARYGNIPEKDQ